jgi:hypothetical protein
MLARGDFARPGVHAPEAVGAVPGLLQRMLSELERRGVRCRARVERLQAPNEQLEGQLMEVGR